MNILLITPNFFDYPAQICEEIQKMGHEVDWFDDRPSTNCFIKAIIRIKKDYINIIIARYFDKILNNIKGKKYDKVLLISGQSLSFNEKMLCQLKKIQSSAEFILYQWDSINNFPYIEHLQKYFDRCYSFDRNDCAAKSFYKFLPLFYTRNYETIGNVEKTKTIYDCSYVGTAHPLKFKNINTIANLLKKELPRQFIYHYMPSKLKYAYHKLTAPEYKKARLNDFKMKKLTAEENAIIFKESGCVLDSPQGGQTGLTIRTIECLGAKKKLVTANTDIVNYDFYREENILVVDNGKFNKNSKFFTEEYLELPEDIYKKYSLNNWLKTIFF